MHTRALNSQGHEDYFESARFKKKKRKSNSFIQQTFLVPCYESGLSEIILRCTVSLLSHQQTSNQEGSPELHAPAASDRVGC